MDTSGKPRLTPFQTLTARIGKPIVAMETVIERILTAVLAGGHVLLEGPPGTGKTLVANAVARAIGLPFGRIQFTVDLLPSDILGTEIFRPNSGSFEIRKGPIFTNVLLADEINRAAPRVQSALLQAMQERQVVLGGTVLDLPAPFVVVATQNPVEHAGTFELPAAQLDRFMICHRVEYPSAVEESRMVHQNLAMGIREERNGSASTKTEYDLLNENESAAPVWDLRAMMKAVHAVHVPATFTEHCVQLVQKTRTHPDLESGCGPRASIALVRAARARAFLLGRDSVTLDDLFELSTDILQHRVRPSLEAFSQDKTAQTLLGRILEDFASSR